jgi:serine/threonine protein kinase
MTADLSMTDCPAPPQLLALMQGDLDDSVRSRVEDHLEACPTCREQLQQLLTDSLLTPLTDSPTQLLLESIPKFLRELASQLPEPLRSPPISPRPAVFESVPEIPGFHQMEWIGRGGSGEVYRAWQPALARWVAIKTLPPGRSPAQSDRVLREARILGRLNHRHIVQIHDTGELAGRPYLVMEWVAGGSLQQRIAKQWLSIREVVDLGHQLAQALEAVHALGIIHRDLKPANVLLDGDGERSETTSGAGLLAKLTDFNIAMDPESTHSLTLTGQVVGTPQFMAPEQTGLVPQLGVVGPATDIYGLGAVLYAALTCQAPHDANCHLSVLRDVASGEPRSPRELRPEIPPDLETIVVKCLRQDPLRRYRSAGELAEDLDRYRQGRPISARPYSLPEKLWHWSRRRPLWGAISVTGLVFAGLSLAGWDYHLERTSQLQSDLQHSQRLVDRTSSQILDERRESRRAKWETLKQLTAKAQTMLQSNKLVPEQRRGLLEVLRRHYRNRIEDLDPDDRSTAIDLALGLDQMTAFEEQERFFQEVLDDLPLLDRMAEQFSPELPLEGRLVERDMRRTRVLIQLERLDEAAAQLDALLERDMVRPLGRNLLVVLQTVEQLSHALTTRGHSAQGEFVQILARLDRALAAVQRHLANHPDDLPFWSARFEFLARKLQVVKLAEDPLGIEAVEQDWLRYAREFITEVAPDSLSGRVGRLKLMQRMVELALTRSPELARELLPLWSREIAGFRTWGSGASWSTVADRGETPERTYQAELVSQQVDCLIKWSRLGPSDALHISGTLSGWRDALAAAKDYLRLNPEDHATRFRLGYSLRDQARFLLSRDAQRVWEVAQEASAVLAPGAGGGKPHAECQQLLSDVLYLSASALRTLGRLRECRAELEQAYLITQGGANRDIIAADLVWVHLALGDRAGAEKAAGWILNDGPPRQEANRLLQQVKTAQTSQ